MNVSIIGELLNKEGWDAGAVVCPPASHCSIPRFDSNYTTGSLVWSLFSVCLRGFSAATLASARSLKIQSSGPNMYSCWSECCLSAVWWIGDLSRLYLVLRPEIKPLWHWVQDKRWYKMVGWMLTDTETVYLPQTLQMSICHQSECPSNHIPNLFPLGLFHQSGLFSVEDPPLFYLNYR